MRTFQQDSANTWEWHLSYRQWWLQYLTRPHVHLPWTLNSLRKIVLSFLMIKWNSRQKRKSSTFLFLCSGYMSYLMHTINYPPGAQFKNLPTLKLQSSYSSSWWVTFRKNNCFLSHLFTLSLWLRSKYIFQKLQEAKAYRSIYNKGTKEMNAKINLMFC